MFSFTTSKRNAGRPCIILSRHLCVMNWNVKTDAGGRRLVALMTSFSTAPKPGGGTIRIRFNAASAVSIRSVGYRAGEVASRERF